ncbi:MAG: VOC family protein [Bacteroidota bacterium]
MTRLDPIIAVKDVEESSKWYKQIFGFRADHGGDTFSVLVTDDGEIIMCLHKWGEHSHPTLTNPASIQGNGLLLYFRTNHLKGIYENAKKSGCKIEEDLHINPNSLREEFSFRDPDGYFLTITQFHKYDD